jgi:hypothetical protein
MALKNKALADFYYLYSEVPDKSYFCEKTEKKC